MFFVNSIVERKLKETLKDLPESVHFSYSGLHVNVFQGVLFVENPELEVLSDVTNEVNLKVKLEDFKLKNVSYWQYVVNGTIHLDQVLLQDAQVSYIKGRKKSNSNAMQTERTSASKSDQQSKSLKSFNKSIKIDTFNLSHALLTVYEGVSDSIFLKSESVNITLNGISFDSISAKKNIPFTYSNYRVLTDSLKFNVGVYETVSLQELKLTKEEWQVSGFKFQTKYSKAKFSKMLKKERDHFNVQIDSFYIKQPEFGSVNNRFYFKSDTILVKQPDIKIYRNKLVADDYTVKPLYSKMLRDLKIDLTLPILILSDGNIVYEEKVKTGVRAGSIVFKDFNATIKNISNTYKSPTKTELDIQTNFFGTAPLHANWTFDVNNKNDDFTFKTQIGTLPVSRLNRFTEHNLNIKLEGQFDKIYTRIDGNVSRSFFDFNVKYEDVKVHVLNKKKKRNRFLSSIANIFIRSDSNKNTDGFIEKKGRVTRDKTKSVFNFFWLNMQEGLKLVFLGDGII
ncbi:hypothetical protein [Formosa sp. L2A11]|uniref:hypothetical protein n=1 Tax=Formosa sp. L2A11 TaxID=2686363 RepID=UPI00131C38C9|nr:hypothetical protein [Formosa sp. L2A11]